MSTPLDATTLDALTRELWPEKNHDDPANLPAELEQLLEELRNAGITTADGLRALAQARRDEVLAHEANEVREATEELERTERVAGASPARVKQGVYFSQIGMTRKALEVSGA